MESAISAANSGAASGDALTVLIGAEGGIHIVSHSDWPLDRLAAERGARMAYRVSHSQADGKVRVDGIQGATVCHLESDDPGARARDLLRDRPQYLLETRKGA